MKYQLSICLLLLCLTTTLAQAQPKPYYFSLQAEKLDLPASPWRVTQVLDLRPDRSRLGLVRRGLDNQISSADFKQPLAAELLQFLQARLKTTPTARPVVMRVFTLSLNEDPRPNSEAAEAEIIADFLEPQADSTFRVVQIVGETTRRAGIEVTGFHAPNIALVLQQALGQLAAPAPAPETLSRAEALAGRRGAMAQRFAIQKAATPKRGFYRSFDDFRNNAPQEPEYAFAIQHIARSGKRWQGNDETRPIYLNADPALSNRPVPTAGLWGLSDGHEMLVAYRNHFYKLLPAADGRSYTFVGPPVFDGQTNGTLVAAAVVGGAMAGAVGGAVAAALVGGSSGTMDVYELHLTSGHIVAAEQAGQTDAQGFTTATDTAGVFIYRSNADKDQPVMLNISGYGPVQLPARHYAAITWLDRRKELKICLQNAAKAENCRAFVPDFTQPTYFECTVPTDGSAPVLRPVSVKTGGFEVQRKQQVVLE